MVTVLVAVVVVVSPLLQLVVAKAIKPSQSASQPRAPARLSQVSWASTHEYLYTLGKVHNTSIHEKKPNPKQKQRNTLNFIIFVVVVAFKIRLKKKKARLIVVVATPSFLK